LFLILEEHHWSQCISDHCLAIQTLPYICFRCDSYWAYWKLSSLNFSPYKHRISNMQFSSLCMIIGKKRYVIWLSLLRDTPPLFINLIFWIYFNIWELEIIPGLGVCVQLIFSIHMTKCGSNGWWDLLRLLEYALELRLH
jgi:hypothetical protein